MATLVGLVTVPYLARRVAFERLRETFRYEITKAGVTYVLATIVIGIAALNTGNNLLYIVVAAMLAAILVSGVASAMVLRRLELEVRLPEQVFAKRPVNVDLGLRNPRRFLPAFSIRIVPAGQEERKTVRKRWQWERTIFAFPLHRLPEHQWVRVRDWKVKRVEVVPSAPGIFEGMVYFPYLPAEADLHAQVELNFARRGRYQESGFGMATRFPFSFLTKTREVALEREILVYPSVEPTRELFEILPVVRGERESFVRGRGSDLHLIRDYLPEDPARHVDWKATAKSRCLKVREFSREDERHLCIVFDNPLAGLIAEAAYEGAVELAASLAWHLSSENADLSFVVPGRPPMTTAQEFLAQLAVIEPAHEPCPLLKQLSSQPRPGYNIVITGRARETLPGELWTSCHFIFASDPKPGLSPHMARR